MKNLLDYLDNEIKRILKATGDYPKKLTLSKSSYNKMKEEMKEYAHDYCWYHFKEPNYRGIPIEIKEQ